MDTNILIGTRCAQLPDSKNTFLQILLIKGMFSRILGGIRLYGLYAQTVTLGANLLFKAKTIPQNAKRVFF